MAKSKYALYKQVKLPVGWRYCKAAWYPNHKIKPHVVLVNGVEERHHQGSYYMYNDARGSLREITPLRPQRHNVPVLRSMSTIGSTVWFSLW